MMKMSPSWIASFPTQEMSALTVWGSVPTCAGRSSFPSSTMRPSPSQMAALKSRPSLTTSEWPTRSSIRPISSTTLMNAFRRTSNVIGSIRPVSALVLIREPPRGSWVVALGQGDDDVADAVDACARALRQDQRAVDLLDDARARELVSVLEAAAIDDPRAYPARLLEVNV